MRNIRLNELWLGIVGLLILMGLPAWAQPPNPTNLEVIPTDIVFPGNLYYCSNDGAGITADIRGIWTHDGVDTPFGAIRALSFDSDGCIDVFYTDAAFAGNYTINYIRNSDNGPDGPWQLLNPAVTFTLRPQAANPTSFRANPTTITIPGSINYCADNAANMSIGIRGTWAHDGVEESFVIDRALNLGNDGCVDYRYTEPTLAGVYTINGIRNQSNTPNGAWVMLDPPVTVTTRRTGPAGPPTITAISPDIIRGEQVTLVTVTGTNLLDSDVSIIQDTSGRTFPTVSLFQISFDGNELQVKIDASDPNVLHYYSLAVSNSQGQVAVQFRVIPKARPRWDVMTPGNPATGPAGSPARAYVLEIDGFNLQDVTVVPVHPDRIIISNQTNTETTITGVLEVVPNAPLGATYLLLQDPDGQCVPAYYGDCRITIQIVASSGVMDPDENLTANLNNPDVPALYLARTGEHNGFAINDNFGGNLEEDPSNAPLLCTLGPYRLLSKTYQKAFVYCRGQSTFTNICLQGMELGQLANLGSFVLSIFFEVDIGVQWIGALFPPCYPISRPDICVRAAAGADIPGCCWAWASVDECFGRAERFNPQVSAVVQLTYEGGPCLSVIRQDSSPIAGVATAEVRLDACCPDVLKISTRGDTFRNTRFAAPFNLASQAGATAGATCRLDITQPTRGSRFNITQDPAMPAITAQATATGIDTTQTQFTWSSSIRYALTSNRTIQASFPDQSGLGLLTYTPNFASVGIRGGTLTFSVAATVSGTSVRASTDTTVQGTNPSAAAVDQSANTFVLRHLACQESRRRQFNAPINGGTGRPLTSPTGAVGIMQVINPAPSDEAVWNWQQNITEGRGIYGQKLNEAASLHQNERARLNQERRARGLRPCPPNTPLALSAVVGSGGDPNISQVERDAIRRYNCGREYRWEPRDADNCAGNWVIAPTLPQPACRPADRAYVSHVLNCQ